jgi:hypothetical protein
LANGDAASALMKASSEASIAIFLTLRNARAQGEVLIAAAEMTLTGPNREIFDAIMLLYRGLQSQRADIAHGIFGTADPMSDDEIPWIETKNFSKEWIDKFYRPQLSILSPSADDKLGQKKHSFVYKLRDLNRLADEINQLWGITFAFTSSLQLAGWGPALESLQTQLTLP